MRPYLAVIRDSFHEALVSRVLWILLAVTTLVLVLLVPLGFVEQAGSYLSVDDFLNRDKFVARLVKEGRSPDPSPGRRIWELLDDSMKQSLAQYAKDPTAVRFRFFGFVDELQKMLAQADFYRAADWAKVSLPKAAKEMEAKGLKNLPADQLARFNRLALNAAFPNDLAPIPPKQIQLAYFRWELGLPLPVEPEQLFPAINQLLVTTLAIFLGVAGVFVAVMVTASMIPQTFEAGSVDLLLSRPISRSWLFLSKFVGGCAFIAINAAYFIGGLWLILGVRFGLWNQRLLLAIPLYLFLFAIYYGVSSLAGVVWRNAIVSVVMAVVFWFVCWLLGTATSLVEALSLNPRRLETIVPAGEDLIAVNASGEVFRWDDTTADWSKIFTSRSDNNLPFGFAGRMVGPVYDASGEQILAFKYGMPGFSPLAASNRLLIGKRGDDWRRTEGVNVPDGALAMFLGGNREILVGASTGIYRLEGDLTARQEDINVFGLHIPLPERGGRFVSVGSQIQLRPLQGGAIDPETHAIALFDGHRLVLLEVDSNGAYRQTHEQSFDQRLNGKVALAGGQIYLALEGEVRHYDGQLKLTDTLEVESRSTPQHAAVSPDGRYLAIVYRDGRLWFYDAKDKQPMSPSITGQGDISAVAFDDTKMYLADRLTRVTSYDLRALAKRESWQGAMPLVEKIYRYALHPLYTVFPKPSQLNQTVTYLLTANDSRPGAIRLDDNERGPQKLDVWGPVWSNLAFLVVVLAIGCVYISRKDF